MCVCERRGGVADAFKNFNSKISLHVVTFHSLHRHHTHAHRHAHTQPQGSVIVSNASRCLYVCHFSCKIPTDKPAPTCFPLPSPWRWITRLINNDMQCTMTITWLIFHSWDGVRGCWRGAWMEDTLRLSRMAEHKRHALSFNYLVVFVPLTHWPLHSIILLPKQSHGSTPETPPPPPISPPQHIKNRLINNINIFSFLPSSLSLSCPDFSFCSLLNLLVRLCSSLKVHQKALHLIARHPWLQACRCLCVCVCVRVRESLLPLEPPEG